MFVEFRHIVKDACKEKNLTYAQIATQAGIEESTVKSFMCGANDSRRVAERLADALGIKLIYSNGTYTVAETDLNQ